MRIGSLFTGYGGLDLAVQQVLGGTVAWHCDNDPGASKVLAHHWPDVPNLGDITAVDWAAVEPVDVLTGGFPCQDVSAAGNRAGMRPGTRSGLWTHMAYAVDRLRPRLVVVENVRGLLNAPAHSPVEPCPWCVGDDPGGALRALGAVLGDLAGLGYDAQWCGLRAADAGAPHGRFRVFLVARPAADTAHVGHQRNRNPRGRRPGPADSGDTAAHTDGHGPQGLGRLEPVRRDPHRRDRADIAWGQYEPAIRRWEHVLGRPAPPPTEPGRSGPRLAPAFVEWMMGLPAGHVTAVPGLTRNHQLKALGNGVVPQQAALALRWLLAGEWHGVDGGGDVLPTPRATRGGSATETTALLPTPAVNDMGAGKTPEAWDTWTADMQARHGNGNGHGKSLAIEAARLGGGAA